MLNAKTAHSAAVYSACAMLLGTCRLRKSAQAAETAAAREPQPRDRHAETTPLSPSAAEAVAGCRDRVIGILYEADKDMQRITIPCCRQSRSASVADRRGKAVEGV
jgi:hypothetical protein